MTAPPQQIEAWPAEGWTLADRLALPMLCLRAGFELARARVSFASMTPAKIVGRNRELAAMPATHACDDAASRHAAGRIAYVVPRIAKRMPFRSDCLVQALAAQSWLASKGLQSRVVIGVERPAGEEFGAHAWLLFADSVVTGGEVDRYHVLVSE